MVAIDLEFIQCYPKTPELYSCDGSDKWHPEVIYQPEPPGQESFDSIPMVLERGWGDCDDLAAWRCADLNFRGIKARPYLKWRDRGPNQNMYHAVVLLPDGRVEDPSLALGMHGAPITRRPMFINPGPVPKPEEVLPGEMS